MSSTKKITIITPSYNQGQYLEQTIDSVLSQNYSNLEYILIDGASTDNSLAIIKKHAKHLAHWVSEPDRGQSHAINKGLELATGDVINWLNSDDYLESGALQILNEKFSEPTVNVVIGRSHIVQNGKVIRTSLGTDIYEDNLPKTIGCARIDQPETYFRTKVFDRLGPLNEMLHFVMDKEFWLRYLIHFGLNGVDRIPDVLVNFRLHANSKTQSLASKFELESNTLMYQFAAINGVRDKATLITQMFPCDLEKLNFAFTERIKAEPDLVLKSIDNFFLYKADEAYYRHHHSKCLSILSHINRDSLKEADQKRFNRLTLKSRYLPVWLIKQLRT